MAVSDVSASYSTAQLGVGACLLLMALVLLKPVLLDALSPLRSVPGPLLTRITKLWRLKKAYEGDFEHTLIDLHAKYGPVVRLAPNEYSIDDVDSIKILYGHGTKFVKSKWYTCGDDPTHPENYDVFSERDPRAHSNIRRKTASLYAMSSLLKLEPFVDDCTAILETRLGEMASSGVSLDVGYWMQCYAFDVVGNLTFSKRFGFLDKGEDISGIMAAIHGFLGYFYMVGIYPGIHGFLFRLLQAIASNNGGEAVDKFTADAQQRVAQEKSEVGNDFFSRLSEMRRNDPATYSEWDVTNTCRDNIGAGSDTTGISLTSILYHIYRDPAVLAKLREEIDQMDRLGELSSPPTFKEAQNLPYLQAVIKEGLRIHPAGGFSLDRVVPEEGAVICGRYFPRGVIVGVNPWVAHFSKAVFGHDSDQFRPERWLQPKEMLSDMEKYYIPFGSGSRTCLGKNISLMEISKVVPQIVKNFDLNIITNGDGKAYNTLNRCFVRLEGLRCLVSRRER